MYSTTESPAQREGNGHIDHPRFFPYTSDTEVLRAALPLLMADPLYRASAYMPRQTLDLDRLTLKQFYNCIPTVLRWNRKEQASRKADLLYQFERLHQLHGPLEVAVMTLPAQGSLYDPWITKYAAVCARRVVHLDFSAVWKLEKAGDKLHLHITAPAGTWRSGPMPLEDIGDVYDLEGHAEYLAKAGDAGLSQPDHDRHPDPVEVARVVLEYIHVKSQGSLDRQDWDDAPSIRGYLTGYREREAADLGLINKQQSRPRPKREPKAATIEADSLIPIHTPLEQFTPPSKPVKQSPLPSLPIDPEQVRGAQRTRPRPQGGATDGPPVLKPGR